VTPEAQRRLAKAGRFLGQSKGLSVNEVPEAIIHLSYYAMLHAAASVLVERQGHAPKTHGAIIGQFSQLIRNDGEEARFLGRAFNRAEDTRLAADYSDDVTPTAEEAAEAREVAGVFVAYCRSMLAQ
jgi:uncharacterized protein (UPF0332 family)